MIGIVLIHAVASLAQGRIVVLGSSRPKLDALVNKEESTKATDPGVHGFGGTRIGTVKIQSQLGGYTIVPNSIVIFRQLKRREG